MAGSKTSYLTLLKSKRFSPFFSSQVFTNFGDGLFSVMVICVSIRLGFGAAQLGVVTFFSALPRGLFGPLGGVIADRVDKRQLLLLLEVMRTLIMAVMPLLYHLGWLNVWVLSCVGFMTSGLFSFGVPAARSLIPRLVDKGDLQLANSLIQGITWPAYFFGAGLLTFAQKLFELGNVFFVIAACFLISLLALLKIEPSDSIVTPQKLSMRSVYDDLCLGYRCLLVDRVLHARVLLYGAYSFFWRGLVQVALPLLVVLTLPGQVGLYGMLMLANGVGELMTNLIVGKKSFKQPLLVTFWGEFVIGIAALVMAGSVLLPFPSIGLFVAVFLVGVSASLIDIPLMTVIQREVPENHTGKVVSYWFTLGALGGSLGALTTGKLLASAPLLPCVTLAGLTAALGCFLSLSWARSKMQGTRSLIEVSMH